MYIWYKGMKQLEEQSGLTVFYSYASADKDVRDQLARHLSQLKRDVSMREWQHQETLAGSDRAQALNQAIYSAHLILLLMISDFLASDVCQSEMHFALERQKLGEVCVVPIIIRPCDWQSSPCAQLQYLPRNGQPITTWRNRDHAFKQVVVDIRHMIEVMPSLSVSSPLAASPLIWNVPYPRNPFFIGRDDLLSHLHTKLQGGQPRAVSQYPQAISGLGGIGKTQIAIEYAYRFSQKYQAILWTHAESRETLVSSYVTLATLLNLPTQNMQEHASTVQSVKRWLQTHREWLLILDNADELALVSEFLPSTLEGHILLTTRAQAMGRLAYRIDVETFSADQGALLCLLAMLPLSKLQMRIVNRLCRSRRL